MCKDNGLFRSCSSHCRALLKKSGQGCECVGAGGGGRGAGRAGWGGGGGGSGDVCNQIMQTLTGSFKRFLYDIAG